jgi:hypothetical protein
VRGLCASGHVLRANCRVDCRFQEQLAGLAPRVQLQHGIGVWRRLRGAAFSLWSDGLCPTDALCLFRRVAHLHDGALGLVEGVRLTVPSHPV